MAGWARLVEQGAGRDGSKRENGGNYGKFRDTGWFAVVRRAVACVRSGTFATHAGADVRRGACRARERQFRAWLEGRICDEDQRAEGGCGDGSAAGGRCHLHGTGAGGGVYQSSGDNGYGGG